jgi:molecular chaperone DnaK
MITIDRAVGIDLGTTHSEIALLTPSEKDVLIYQDRFGRSTIPSAVAWDAHKQTFAVGRAAKAQRGTSPESGGPVLSIKRSMGRADKTVVGPHSLSPEEISSKILAELVRLMEGSLAEKAAPGVSFVVRRAVITVPAYFDALQVEATRRAGELAGLSVLGILQEPTAASIHHTFRARVAGGGNYLVYDLGGGTFDVSVLKCVAGEYQVLAIDGDNFLGGDDFDRRFAEHLRKKLVDQGYTLDLDLRGSAADRTRFEALLGLAEETKHSLSTAEVVSLSRQNLFVDQAGEPVSVELEVGRAEYASLIADLCARTIECCERALGESQAKAGVGLADIDQIILVGGSTRVPAVFELVTERLAKRIGDGSKSTEAIVRESVDTVVALGAAVHAAELGGMIVESDGVRVQFTNRLVTEAPRHKVALTVLAPEGARSVALRPAGGGPQSEAALDDKRAARVELDVGGAEENAFLATVKGAEGAALAEIPFAIYRGATGLRPSALSRPSVTSKDLSVEVVRSGRRERTVLVPRGTGLPTDTVAELATADQSGAVVLRLLEGRVPIKTLALPVARDVPIGSRVELAVRVDESMRVEATANVLGQKMWVAVDPVAVEALTDDDLEQLLTDAEAVSRSFWGNTGDHVRREVEHLTTSVRETIGTDPAKLAAHAERLRRLLQDLAEPGAEGLNPSVAVFEGELSALKRLVYRSPGLLVGMDRETWEARLVDVEARAETARLAADAVAWRRVYNEVQALYETAHQEEFAQRRTDDPNALLMRASSVEKWAARVQRLLLDLELSKTPELLALQTRERDRLLGLLDATSPAALRERIGKEGTSLADVRRGLETLELELERLDEAAQRVPSLGLVTDRTRRPRGDA